MNFKNTKLGFTLIELLVVITIIGILATGAVSTYTSQIQKARDSVRLTDVTAIKSGVEQFYQDKAEYPYSSSTAANGDKAFSGITVYTPKLPKDPKSGQKRANAAFDYVYTVGKDTNLIVGQDYEVSTSFENQGNIDAKALNIADGGNDDVRLELGIDLTGNDTQVTTSIASTINTLTCVVTAGTTTACSSEGTKLVIRGN